MDIRTTVSEATLLEILSNLVTILPGLHSKTIGPDLGPKKPFEFADLVRRDKSILFKSNSFDFNIALGFCDVINQTPHNMGSWVLALKQ